MRTVQISFGTADRATKFVDTMNGFNSHFDLNVGQYTVDAKSILGVLSIDLRKNVELKIFERDNEMDRIMDAIQPYILA